MDDKIQYDQSIGQFSPDSSWIICGDEADDGAYFFGSERENNALSQFGWNSRPPRFPEQGNDGVYGGVLGIRSADGIERSDLEGSHSHKQPQPNLEGVAGGGEASASASNPSVSSSSSEDPPEKSTGKLQPSTETV